MDQAVIDQEWTLEERRSFLNRPLDERRRLMLQQATEAADLYERPAETNERLPWQGGDIVENLFLFCETIR